MSRFSCETPFTPLSHTAGIDRSHGENRWLWEDLCCCLPLIERAVLSIEFSWYSPPEILSIALLNLWQNISEVDATTGIDRPLSRLAWIDRLWLLLSLQLTHERAWKISVSFIVVNILQLCLLVIDFLVREVGADRINSEVFNRHVAQTCLFFKNVVIF